MQQCCNNQNHYKIKPKKPHWKVAHAIVLNWQVCQFKMCASACLRIVSSNVFITEYLKKLNFLSCIGSFSNVELFCVNMGGAIYFFLSDCGSQKLLLKKLIFFGFFTDMLMEFWHVMRKSINLWMLISQKQMCFHKVNLFDVITINAFTTTLDIFFFPSFSYFFFFPSDNVNNDFFGTTVRVFQFIFSTLIHSEKYFWVLLNTVFVSMMVFIN